MGESGGVVGVMGERVMIVIVLEIVVMMTGKHVCLSCSVT